MNKRFLLLIACAGAMLCAAAKYAEYVNPMIGAEGLGRVFIGPSAPYGMVKPSPDCTSAPNSGWLPMPEQVNGFSQVHVSGTGGGPKYGNVLVMPINTPSASYPYSAPKEENNAFWIDYRKDETAALAYYATTLSRSDTKVEITTAERASMYRISYPAWGSHGMVVDAGFFLGENPVPKAREAQQFEGSHIYAVSTNAVAGSTSISGGWNNGALYTVYFYAETDAPFSVAYTWGESRGENASTNGVKSGAVLLFGADVVNVRIGISFSSIDNARQHAQSIAGKSFDEVRQSTVAQWERLFERFNIDDSASEAHKHMFYTALYHTMIQPVDRSGDNPKWVCDEPYYDDYYAIWDTYRTSSPLITLIDEQREADIVRALIDIYEHEGFMPDARSGNSNGRTQGGSNAEIVIADAFVKNVPGIDYRKGLKAMLKDAEVAPADDEAEGRGGLEEYNSLGYIPHGIDRAGNRTVEYSLCDYAIATVAKGLGEDALAKKYFEKSHNWTNTWRDGYEHSGARGFIMPRDRNGNWLDEIPYGAQELQRDTYHYTPALNEGPWHTKWWGTFFYEGISWEYSLSMPHDVPLLIEKCGGAKAFDERLDIFFDKGFYNVNNEPSFLSPCLYHWIGRPDKTSERVLSIVNQNYSDGAAGLPGNDDSGAMSSWFAFHFIGLYPNAGHDYYLIHTPMVKSATITANGKNKFVIEAKNLSDKNKYIVGAKLNGAPYPYSTIRHADIVRGGKLELQMGSKPAKWGTKRW